MSSEPDIQILENQIVIMQSLLELDAYILQFSGPVNKKLKERIEITKFQIKARTL